ncbi:hypothetical protein CC1G_13112 [Coprinopsis cinerea okayama7|uniref:Uncharacterized protein n=1 Tax=Coprinopsis cinerea (strain Okayama-7 / 130 / ATCC MYA-4618 / FGSC 9003) TaxID=240176 RepID=A8PAU4_COPC7|nr:hypothetical protein CC1G_13112 [Coprinopsis cinerea okayama7\|eukprot:XP_001840054.2 hypothetical protein CC1G_13112 [Coprinopsis cinerea okayama7\
MSSKRSKHRNQKSTNNETKPSPLTAVPPSKTPSSNPPSRWRYVELPETPPPKPSLARTRIRKNRRPSLDKVDDPDTDSSTEYLPFPKRRKGTPVTDDGLSP